MQVDRIQLAAAKIVEVEERIPFPPNLPVLHPIRMMKEAEQQETATHCLVCGRNHVRLEQHHIAGKANFPDIVALCIDCHGEVTNIFQSKWIPCRNSQRNPLECFFLGWSDIFYLLWHRTGHAYFYELSKIFALNARYQREA